MFNIRRREVQSFCNFERALLLNDQFAHHTQSLYLGTYGVEAYGIARELKGILDGINKTREEAIKDYVKMFNKIKEKEEKEEKEERLSSKQIRFLRSSFFVSFVDLIREEYRKEAGLIFSITSVRPMIVDPESILPFSVAIDLIDSKLSGEQKVKFLLAYAKEKLEKGFSDADKRIGLALSGYYNDTLRIAVNVTEKLEEREELKGLRNVLEKERLLNEVVQQAGIAVKQAFESEQSSKVDSNDDGAAVS